jgi:lipoate-protein ligase A
MASGPEVWRRLPLERLEGPAAVARAEALLEAAADGPVLAWSALRRPALVLGRAPGSTGVDAAACEAAGIPVLRRASGGGPVLWDDGLLGLDVALPREHRLAGADVVAAYAWLGEALAEALRALGAPARAVGVAEARVAEGHPLAARACYGSLSPFEVVVDGRKVVGLAQVRRRTGALFQAGIVLRLDPDGLAALLDLGAGRAAFAEALGARAVGLDEVGPPRRTEEVVAAVEAALRRREGLALAGDAPDRVTASAPPP